MCLEYFIPRYEHIKFILEFLYRTIVCQGFYMECATVALSITCKLSCRMLQEIPWETP